MSYHCDSLVKVSYFNKSAAVSILSSVSPSSTSLKKLSYSLMGVKYSFSRSVTFMRVFLIFTACMNISKSVSFPSAIIFTRLLR